MLKMEVRKNMKNEVVKAAHFFELMKTNTILLLHFAVPLSWLLCGPSESSLGSENDRL